MSNKKLFEGSKAFEDAEHQRAALAQFEVMRELKLTVWDSTNVEAMKALHNKLNRPLRQPRQGEGQWRNWIGHHGT